MVAKPTVQEDSDSDSEPRAPAKEQAPPKAPAVQMDSDEEDDDEEEEAPAKTAAAKALADRKAPRVEVDTDDSDDEVEAPKAPAKPKAVVDTDDSDEEAPEPAPAKQKAAAGKKKSESEVEAANKKAKLDAKVDGSQKGAENDADALRVYIEGVPFKFKEDDLRKQWAECGQIKSVKVLTHDSGKSRGIAYITFKNKEGVAAALKFNGNDEKYPRFKLKVVVAKPKVQGVVKKDAPKKDGQKQDKAKQDTDKKVAKEGEASSGKPAAKEKDRILSEKLLKGLTDANLRGDLNCLEVLGAKIVRRAQAVREEKERRRAKSEQFMVVVEGVPTSDFDREAFRRRFADCGEIAFDVLYSKEGRGKIGFKSEEAVQKALSYSGTKCKDCVLSVKRPKVGDPSSPKPEDTQGKKSKRKAAEEQTQEAAAATAQPKKQRKVDSEMPASEADAVPKKKGVEEKPAEPVEKAAKKKKKASQ